MYIVREGAKVVYFGTEPPTEATFKRPTSHISNAQPPAPQTRVEFLREQRYAERAVRKAAKAAEKEAKENEKKLQQQKLTGGDVDGIQRNRATKRS